MDFAQKLAKDLFLKTIQQLRQPAILLHQKSDGLFETISVTEAFAKMMECTSEQALQLMNDNGYLTSTHPEDRIFVRRMLRRHVNEEGGADLIIRKTTAKHNIISNASCITLPEPCHPADNEVFVISHQR